MAFSDAIAQALVPRFPAWPNVLPPPLPAQTLWPSRSRPELIVDCWRVQLADAQGNLIGFNDNWGGGSGPLGAFVYAERSQTRDF